MIQELNGNIRGALDNLAGISADQPVPFLVQ